LKKKAIGHKEASRIENGDLMIITKEHLTGSSRLSAGYGDTNFEGCDDM